MTTTDVIEVPIRSAAGRVHIDRRRTQRDILNGGRTSRAAARLAVMYLNSFIKREGLTQVADTTLQVSEDFMHGTRDVIAYTRTIRAPFDIGEFRLPSDAFIVKLALPAGRNATG